MTSSLGKYSLIALVSQVCLNLWMAALHELTGWEELVLISFVWYEAGGLIINYVLGEPTNTFVEVIIFAFLVSATIYSLVISLFVLVTTIAYRAFVKWRQRRHENARLITVQLQPTHLSV